MKTYDLYGVKSENLEEARISIEQALGITLVAHESSYHCGDYYRLGNDGDEEGFILQKNFDLSEQEWTEEKFQEYEILLYVDGTLRAQEIQELLTSSIPGITLLRREIL